MATVEVIEIKPVDPPKGYLLRINQEELDFLICILGGIGGYDSSDGWRSLVDNLYGELYIHFKRELRTESIFEGNLMVKSNPIVKR